MNTVYRTIHYLILIIYYLESSHKKASIHWWLKRNPVKNHWEFCQYQRVIPKHWNCRQKKFSFCAELFGVFPQSLNKVFSNFLQTYYIRICIFDNFEDSVDSILHILLLKPNIICQYFDWFYWPNFIFIFLLQNFLTFKTVSVKFILFVNININMRFCWSRNRFKTIIHLILKLDNWKMKIFENHWCLVSHLL